MYSHQDDVFDRFSTWSIVLIAVTVVSQLIVNNGQGVLEKAFNARHPSASQSVSTDSFEKLIEIDNEVKIADVGTTFEF